MTHDEYKKEEKIKKSSLNALKVALFCTALIVFIMSILFYHKCSNSVISLINCLNFFLWITLYVIFEKHKKIIELELDLLLTKKVNKNLY